jgi:predicted transcriptional regulator
MLTTAVDKDRHMRTITLTDEDVAVLSALREGPTRTATLADAVDADHPTLDERLTGMTDVGLVHETGNGYTLTESGQRILNAPANRTTDSRIDTSPAIEQALSNLDIRPDLEAAVRSAFVFLAYWGEATESEIKEAIYKEHPAGYESRDEWWRDGVSERLVALPGVTHLADERSWQYVEDNGIDRHATDGRHVLGPPPVYGSVRHVIEDLGYDTSETAAMRAVFALLYETNAATKRDIKAVYDDHPAGHASADEWWRKCIDPGIDGLPSVVRHPDDVWQYMHEGTADERGRGHTPEER